MRIINLSKTVVLKVYSFDEVQKHRNQAAKLMTNRDTAYAAYVNAVENERLSLKK